MWTTRIFFGEMPCATRCAFAASETAMMAVDYLYQMAVFNPWTCAADGIPASRAASAPTKPAVER